MYFNQNPNRDFYLVVWLVFVLFYFHFCNLIPHAEISHWVSATCHQRTLTHKMGSSNIYSPFPQLYPAHGDDILI